MSSSCVRTHPSAYWNANIDACQTHCTTP